MIESATDPVDNPLATKGRLVIDEVTSTEIRGGAYISFNRENTVNGRIQITVCSD